MSGNIRQQQDEERFNVGARNIRNFISKRSGRGTRSTRAILENIDEGGLDITDIYS
jgi:hypothetical protein